LLDLDGQVQPLDIAPGLYQAPAFLEDGRLLVVEGDSLVVVDATSEERTVIAAVAAFSQFAAAGERVAFTVSTSPAPGPLWVTSLGGGGQTSISDEPVLAFEWSPDGSLLYYLGLGPEGMIPAIWDGDTSKRFAPAFPSSVFLQAYLPFWDQYSRFHTLWQADSTGFYLPRDGEEIAFYPAGDGDPNVVAEGLMALAAPP